MQRPEPPEPSRVSMQSNQSAGEQIYFRDGRYAYGRFDEQSSGGSRDSSSCFLYTFDEQSSGGSRDPSSCFDSIFEVLEENLITFVKTELRRFRRLLNRDYPKCIEDEDVLIRDEEWRSCREALLSTTLHFLRTLEEVKLAECLSNRIAAAEYRHKIRHDLQKKFQSVFREIRTAENPPLLNQNYTEVHITEGGATEVDEEHELRETDKEHEVREIEAASRKPVRPQTIIRQKDIFGERPESHGKIKTVLTKGVAGIGKTVLTQKFSLDWAEDRANQDIVFIFPFTFRELNLLKDKKFSLVKLVHHFFAQTKEAGICSFEDFEVIFIFDGLDECRLPLDFHNNEPLTDVTVSTSVDVLLTNLIRGNLLPTARLWITTRPAAASRIPPEYVSMVTEVRGFTDHQKEEYFRQRFTDNEKARRIISHIKRSRSLHTMCHIPVFCWISASVLEDMLSSNRGELPKTLTEMYIHYLLVQTNGGTETDRLWNQDNRRMIMSLGKLAFEQLQKGNLIFYESDLTESGLDIRAVGSGVFTKIFREERGLYHDKVFSFVHLSLQEFLAALHVHQTFISSDLNLLTGEQTSWWSKIFTNPFKLFYQQAVTEALKSPHGHLDLLLRFLLGLSLETNQSLLRGLVTKTPSSSEINQETVKFIKKTISEDVSPETSINLFHCMNELNDGSLVAKTQLQLRSGQLFKGKLSPAQWSALVFILLSPEEDFDVFDLKNYSASEEALLRLLPVVRASSKALLSDCRLSERSCEALSSVLSSKFSNLTELDLSHNDLQDSGIRLLYVGLRSRHCHLQTLRLSGCRISEQGCSSLALALRSNPSHLRELDLSYNHPGESGVNQFSAGLIDPRWRLDTLKVDHGGVRRLKPGVRKYYFPLLLDRHTVHKLLKLSNNNTTVTRVEVQQSYPDHPDRFDYWTQLMCGSGLTGRCYWEVEWRGDVYISVSYGEIQRRGKSDSLFGCNRQSWSLICSDGHDHTVLHNNEQTPIKSSVGSHRAAVYVDCDAGTLSFYSISSSDTLTHLHTFNTTFTHTLYPGFRICRPGSSVCVCL